MYKMALDVLVCIYVYNIYYICRYAYLYIYICIMHLDIKSHYAFREAWPFKELDETKC